MSWTRLEALEGVLEVCGAVLEAIGGVLEALESVQEAREVVLDTMLGHDSPKHAQERENLQTHNEKYCFWASRGGVLDILGGSWGRLGGS